MKVTGALRSTNIRQLVLQAKLLKGYCAALLLQSVRGDNMDYEYQLCASTDIITPRLR